MHADSRSIFVVLLHSPMLDRSGREVTTAVTNLDIHDIARSCKTYGVKRYYIVNPEAEQERLVGSILGHWREELSKLYHPSRAQALALVRFARSFEEAFNQATLEEDQAVNDQSGPQKGPYVLMPDARDLEARFPDARFREPDGAKAWSYEELRSHMEAGRIPGDRSDWLRPVMIVFGTGWGMSPTFFGQVDRVLAPLRAKREEVRKYNHLSVRAAAAIVLDRVLGDR
jgi:hypothetical protein